MKLQLATQIIKEVMDAQENRRKCNVPVLVERRVSQQLRVKWFEVAQHEISIVV